MKDVRAITYEGSIFIIYFYRLATTSPSCSIRHQLRLATFLQTDEPEDGRFDRLSYCQQAMILQQGGFFIAQACSNILSFLFGENDTVETFIQDVILYRSQQTEIQENMEETRTLWNEHESWVIVSNFLPNVQKVRP